MQVELKLNGRQIPRIKELCNSSQVREHIIREHKALYVIKLNKSFLELLFF